MNDIGNLFLKNSSEETIGPAAHPQSNGTEECAGESKSDPEAMPETYQVTGMAFRVISLLVLCVSIAAIYATTPDSGAQPVQPPGKSASVAPVMISTGPPVDPVPH